MKKFFSLIAIFIFVFAGGLTLVSCGKSEYSITVESPEHGVVYVDNKANVGEIVYFDAVPEDGYELTKITVNNRVITEDHFDMPAKDVVLRATFERKYNITITPSAHGTITILTTNYKGGDLVEFSANPENGYRLQYFDTNVSINYNFSIKDITYSFIMPNFDVVITPHFERVYSITIDKNIQHGNIFVQENAIANSDITLTVQPESNYALQQLTINGVPYYTINNKCSFTMPAADVVISATFVPIEENKSFSITIVQPSHGNVSVNKTSAKYNEYVNVTLTPDDEYEIKHLLINDLPFEINNNPYSFPMPNHDITISAEFVKIGYGAISYNVISMESVEDDSPFDEVYYKNNFINIDGDELKCGYFDGEKYCVETLDFQIENSQIILDTNDPYLSQLTISMGYGNIIVSNDDVTLVYIATPDFNMPQGIYTSPEEINDNIVDLEYVFQENGNIISIANVEYDIPGYDLGKAYIYGNIMIVENVDYDLSNYNLYVGNLSRSAQSVGGFSWDFYNFYYDEFYQYFHDPKPFTYKSAFDETTYTYNNETLSEYPEEKDKFIRFTGNLVTFGAYIYESIEGYGYYEGFLYLEYLPATIDGNNITVDVLIPFSEQSLIITVTAQFSEDKQTLTVNFTDEVIEFHLTTNINFTYGTYQRSENYDTYTRIFIDVIDENGNVMETIKYENDGSPEEPYFIGKFKVFGNICILICTDATNGIYVGIGQISDNTALWSGMNYYTSYNNGLQMEEFLYNYTKIA